MVHGEVGHGYADRRLGFLHRRGNLARNDRHVARRVGDVGGPVPAWRCAPKILRAALLPHYQPLDALGRQGGGSSERAALQRPREMSQNILRLARRPGSERAHSVFASGCAYTCPLKGGLDAI